MRNISFQYNEEFLQKDPLKCVTENKNSGYDGKPKESNENEPIGSSMQYTVAPDVCNFSILTNNITTNDANPDAPGELEIAKIKLVGLFLTFYGNRIASDTLYLVLRFVRLKKNARRKTHSINQKMGWTS